MGRSQTRVNPSNLNPDLSHSTKQNKRTLHIKKTRQKIKRKLTETVSGQRRELVDFILYRFVLNELKEKKETIIFLRKVFNGQNFYQWQSFSFKFWTPKQNSDCKRITLAIEILGQVLLAWYDGIIFLYRHNFYFIFKTCPKLRLKLSRCAFFDCEKCIPSQAPSPTPPTQPPTSHIQHNH